MDTTDSKIVFDEKGVCDHCNTYYKDILPKWHTDEKGEEELWVIIDKIRVFHSEHYYNKTPWHDGYADGSRGNWGLSIVENEYGQDTKVLQHVKDYGGTTSLMSPFFEEWWDYYDYTGNFEFITRIKFGNELTYASRCGISVYGTTRNVMLIRDTGIFVSPEEGTGSGVWYYGANASAGDVIWARATVINGVLTFYYKNALHEEDWIES